MDAVNDQLQVIPQAKYGEAFACDTPIHRPEAVQLAAPLINITSKGRFASALPVIALMCWD